MDYFGLSLKNVKKKLIKIQKKRKGHVLGIHYITFIKPLWEFVYKYSYRA